MRFLFRILNYTHKGLCSFSLMFSGLTDLSSQCMSQTEISVNLQQLLDDCVIHFTNASICNVFFCSVKCPLRPPMCLSALSWCLHIHRWCLWGECVPLKPRIDLKNNTFKGSVLWLIKREKPGEGMKKNMFSHFDCLSLIPAPSSDSGVFSIYTFGSKLL